MTIAARATTYTLGTIGDDTILAQYLYGDLIDGLAGNDTITGLDGNDTLIGGTGRDTLYGMGGFDLLDGGAGNDKLYGGTGDDILRPDGGAIGSDIVDGGDGFDTVDYSNSAGTRGVRVDLRLTGVQDTLGAGKDTIINVENVTGTGFADTITGSAIANILDGGAGNDTLTGLAGIDRLFGGAGNDKLYGGDDNDILGADTDGIGSDFIDGGAGIADVVDYFIRFGGTSGVRVDLNLTGAQNTGGAGIDTIINVENVNGSNFADTLIGNAADNYLYGNDGADVLTGNAGNDTLLGGKANDSIDGGIGDDRLNGGDGADIVSGGDGIDAIRGGTGADILSGGAGADRFYFSGSPFSSDSITTAMDQITDFSSVEDQLILQSFNWSAQSSFLGTAAFSATGIAEVRVTGDLGLQQVQVDYDGNGTVDLAVQLNIIDTALTAANFQLVQVTDF